MGRFDQALNACGRALARAEGVQRLRTYLMCGSILERKGDKPAAKKMYEDGIAYARTLPVNVDQRALQALQTAAGKL
jgi:hypothetical protein